MSESIIYQKTCTRCLELKDVLLFNKNSFGKYKVASRCKRCEKSIRESKIDYYKNRNKKYYESNSEKIKSNSKAWKLDNKQKLIESKRKHYTKNSQQYKERARKWELENKQKHKSLAYFYCAQRRSLKKTATPLWADIEKIKLIYAKAKLMKENGFDVEVDHIIPLVHNDVCGLHVHQNLRIISKKENRSKSNKFSTEEI